MGQNSTVLALLVLLSIFYNAATQNLSPSCVRLQQCIQAIEFGPGGTLSFLSLDHYPTQSEWDGIRNNICATKRTRIRCAINHGCSDVKLISDARVAKERARKMCRPNGREFLRRVRAEESGCLGNRRVVQRYTSNRDTCIVTHLAGVTSSTPAQDICNRVSDARQCDVNFVVDLCSGLTGWVLDMGWLARIQKDSLYEHCYDEANQSRRNLPPPPSQQF